MSKLRERRPRSGRGRLPPRRRRPGGTPPAARARTTRGRPTWISQATAPGCRVPGRERSTPTTARARQTGSGGLRAMVRARPVLVRRTPFTAGVRGRPLLWAAAQNGAGPGTGPAPGVSSNGIRGISHRFLQQGAAISVGVGHPPRVRRRRPPRRSRRAAVAGGEDSVERVVRERCLEVEDEGWGLVGVPGGGPARLRALPARGDPAYAGACSLVRAVRRGTLSRAGLGAARQPARRHPQVCLRTQPNDGLRQRVPLAPAGTLGCPRGDAGSALPVRAVTKQLFVGWAHNTGTPGWGGHPTAPPWWVLRTRGDRRGAGSGTGHLLPLRAQGAQGLRRARGRDRSGAATALPPSQLSRSRVSSLLPLSSRLSTSPTAMR